MNSIRDLDAAIDRWFAEDIGDGDHTTLSTIPSDISGSANLLVKEAGVVAGVALAERIFRRFDPEIKLNVFFEDGANITSGDVVFRVTGKVHTILQCERLVLNVMQRMSGIATNTQSYVKLLEGTGYTHPGYPENHSGNTSAGESSSQIRGGVNHRFGLHDMILIKDNHIDFAGGIEEASQGYKDLP